MIISTTQKLFWAQTCPIWLQHWIIISFMTQCSIMISVAMSAASSPVDRLQPDTRNRGSVLPVLVSHHWFPVWYLKCLFHSVSGSMTVCSGSSVWAVFVFFVLCLSMSPTAACPLCWTRSHAVKVTMRADEITHEDHTYTFTQSKP